MSWKTAFGYVAYALRAAERGHDHDRPKSTREDHRGVADQVSTFLGRGQELRRLISIVGEQALTDDDRRVLAFVDDFENHFVGQREQRRSIEETLDLAWDLLAPFPVTELRRIKPELVERHHRSSR